MLAYCAGYIDGDGSIHIGAYPQGRSKGLYYKPEMSAAGYNRKPMDRLVGLLGGRIEWRPAGWFHYIAGASVADKAVRRLKPYLLSKWRQAEIFLDFRSTVKPGSGSKRVPEAVHERRRSLMKSLTAANKTPCVAMPEVNWSPRVIDAYVAGLIDAEGYLSIRRAGKKKTIVLSVEMIDRPLLEFLKSSYGGTVVSVGMTRTGNPVYRWVLTARKAAEATKKIKPFLTLKSDQADIMIRYHNNVRLWVRRLKGVNQYNLPGLVRSKRLKWENDLKALHNIHKRAGAETKPEQPRNGASDSPVYIDGKDVGPVAAAG